MIMQPVVEKCSRRCLDGASKISRGRKIISNKIRKIFVCAHVLGAFFSLLAFSALAEPKGKAERVEYSYSTPPGQFSKSSPLRITLSGSDCSDLQGKIIGINTKNGTEYLLYEGQFYCLPFVKSLNSALHSSPVRYLNEWELVFENQFRILPQEMSLKIRPQKEERESRIRTSMQSDAKQAGRTLPSDLRVFPMANGAMQAYKVENIDGHIVDQVFSASITEYDYNPPKRTSYKVICWDCKKMIVSPKSLESLILFGFGGYGIAFDGGFAIREDISDRYIPAYRKIMQSDLENLK